MYECLYVGLPKSGLVALAIPALDNFSFLSPIPTAISLGYPISSAFSFSCLCTIFMVYHLVFTEFPFEILIFVHKYLLVALSYYCTVARDGGPYLQKKANRRTLKHACLRPISKNFRAYSSYFDHPFQPLLNISQFYSTLWSSNQPINTLYYN